MEQPAQMTRAFRLPISDLLSCSLDLSDSSSSQDPGTCIEAFIKYLSGLTALSVLVWSFPVMFMQLLHASAVYPPAALHSLFFVYVLWLAYFAWTFLDLPSISSAGSRSRSMNFPCCQPASHQKLSIAVAGAGDTTSFLWQPPFAGPRTSNGCSCLSGNTLMQSMVLVLFWFCFQDHRYSFL